VLEQLIVCVRPSTLQRFADHAYDHGNANRDDPYFLGFAAGVEALALHLAGRTMTDPLAQTLDRIICTVPVATVLAELEEAAPLLPPNGRHALDPNRPPFDPPMINGMTLRTWLIWSWETRKPADADPEWSVWENVNDDFYSVAASKPAVLAVFEPYLDDLPGIKRKFLATFLILTHIGLTQEAADRLVALHAHLRITGDVYDDTMDALLFVLDKYGVPKEGVDQLVPMVNYLGERMVNA
jgi:truncated hemoglobin YjbI